MSNSKGILITAARAATPRMEAIITGAGTLTQQGKQKAITYEDQTPNKQQQQQQ